MFDPRMVELSERVAELELAVEFLMGATGKKAVWDSLNEIRKLVKEYKEKMENPK